MGLGSPGERPLTLILPSRDWLREFLKDGQEDGREDGREPAGVSRRFPVGVAVRVDIGDGLRSPLGIPPPVLVDGTEKGSLVLVRDGGRSLEP